MKGKGFFVAGRSQQCLEYTHMTGRSSVLSYADSGESAKKQLLMFSRGEAGKMLVSALFIIINIIC